MAKKCIVCNEAEAKYMIKDTSDYYCEECAMENFADIGLLLKVEEVAQNLKQFLKTKMEIMGKEEEAEEQEEKTDDTKEETNDVQADQTRENQDF